MAKSTVTSKLDFRVVRNLKDSFSALDSSLYFFYARPLPWEDESNPEDINTSLISETETKSNILALKKINSRDIRLGFKKYDWQSGIVYTEYSDRQSLEGQNYYVRNSENNVYKCIDNNRGTPSSVEPSGVQLSGNISTADGYLWKYMFNLPTSLLRKFDFAEYLPINEDSAVQNSAIPGSIDKINIENGGVGYPSNAALPLFMSGNGEVESSATIEIQNVSSSGEILTVLLTSNGSNYSIVQTGVRKIPVLVRQNVSPGEGLSINAAKLAYGIADVDSNGAISSVEIILSGENYRVGSASLIQPSAIAYAITDSSGKITDVEVEYVGLNYTNAEIIVVAKSGNNAVLTPVISPVNGHGSRPETELNAKTILFNVRIAYEEIESDFTVNNDFRTIGVLENPLVNDGSGGTQKATEDTLTAKTTLTLNQNNANDFSFFSTEGQVDEVIIGTISGATATVIDAPAENQIRFIKESEQSNSIDFQPNETIIGVTSGTTATISSITPAEYIPFSGDLLFINNRTAISRSKDQIETVNLILNF